jgi:hypothetical protein
LCLLLQPAAHHLRADEKAEEALDAKLLAE